MSHIIFNNRINMPTVATPSIGGYTVGYDLDGIIKQKDSAGVVTPLVGNVNLSQTLIQTLNLGNDSGIYSIVMGTGTSIYSGNSNSRIRLDYLKSIFMQATSSVSSSSLLIGTQSISANVVGTFSQSAFSMVQGTASISVSSATQSISITHTPKSYTITHSNSGAGISSVNAIEIGSSYDGSAIENKTFVHINSKESKTNIGVKNSVVIGGQGLTASADSTVYLGNNVNINNAYTLPSADGTADQFLKTDGLGNAQWSSISSITAPLSAVLAVGNNSGAYSILMGTGRGISSANGGSSILLDRGSVANRILISTDGSSMLKGYIRIDDRDLLIGATSGSITIGNKQGLVYTEDYSSTFVANSLVTKQYVLSQMSSVFTTYRTAYVDPNNGNDSTGIVNRVDKPYATVDKAMFGLTSSFATFTSNTQGLIYLKRGVYTESVIMKNYINYFCEEDVIFTANGFTDTVSESVNSNIYGRARFIGSNSNLVPLTILNSSNVRFEFSRIDNFSLAFRVSNTSGYSTVSIKGDYVKNQSQNARTVQIGDAGSQAVSSSVSIDISESLSGAYNVIDVFPGFSGSLSVKCPEIICDGDLSPIGPQPAAQRALRVRSASASVYVKGNIYEYSNTYSADTTNAAVYLTSCNASIEGNINGGKYPAISIASTGNGTFSLIGNAISERESIINQSSSMHFSVSESLIKTSGLGSNPYAILIDAATMSKTYISNSRIYNSLQDSGIILMTTTGSTVGIYNSLAYSPGTSGKFVFCATAVSLGMHNTRCNKDNSDDVEDIFSPSGFIYDSTFYMNGF